MKFCPECGTKITGEPKFCSECGQDFTAGATKSARTKKSTAAKAPSPEPAPAPKPVTGFSETPEKIGAAVKSLSARIKETNKKTLRIVLASVVAGVVLIASVIIVPQLVQANMAAERERLESQSLSDAFPEKTLQKYLPECAEVENTIATSVDYGQAASLAQLTSGVTDARTAAGIVAAHSINATEFAQILTDTTSLLLSTSFTTLVSSEPRGQQMGSDQESDWASQWEKFALSECELETMFDENLSALAATDSATEEIVALASTAPWYPEGWFESPTDSSLAFTWNSGAQSDCYSCYYWEITIISQSSCSSVYAEMTTESNGVAIGWTNSTLGAISGGQQGVMGFEEYGNWGELTGSLTELNCY